MGQIEYSKNLLTVEAIGKLGEMVYYVPIYGNYVCQFDLKSRTIKLLCKIEEESEDAFRLFSKIVDFGEYFFLIPLNAKQLYKVCKKDGMYKAIFIENMDSDDRGYRFSDGYRYKDLLILVGTTYEGFVLYDDKKGCIKYVKDWISDFKGNYISSIYFRKSCLNDGVLYAPFYDVNKLLEFRIPENEIIIYDIDSATKGFCGCCIFENRILMLSNVGFTITEFDLNSKKSRDIYCDVSSKGRYADIKKHEKDVYCLPFKMEGIACYTPEVSKFSHIELNGGDWFTFVQTDSDSLVIDVRSGNCFTVKDRMIAESFQLSYPREYFVDLTKKKLNNEIIRENDNFELYDYLLCI